MTSRSGLLDWQDPGLLRDIEAQTGIDLRMPPKRGTGQKKRKVEKGESKSMILNRLCKALHVSSILTCTDLFWCMHVGVSRKDVY